MSTRRAGLKIFGGLILLAGIGGCFLIGCRLSWLPGVKPKAADNSYCFVCHLNYAAEELTLAHAEAGIGCIACHGASIEHSADEESLTPPERMVPKARINSFCLDCHARRKLARQPKHEELLAGAAAGRPLCTDCHGKHRLEKRMRIWDKSTGRLLEDDGPQGM